MSTILRCFPKKSSPVGRVWSGIADFIREKHDGAAAVVRTACNRLADMV
ncbi:MAG: hypothetical protein II086_09620 [Ruminococcus sp.]|nr:hypothetical protein [Ruminococcus sp.]